MVFNRIIFFFILTLFYQTPVNSKSASLNSFDSHNLSKYFSGIVALENKDNSKALNFLSSSKILVGQHDPYLKKYVYSLVLENKVSQAINLIKRNLTQENSDFFEAKLLLVIDSLKKKQFGKAYDYSREAVNLSRDDRFELAIVEILQEYIFVFKEREFIKKKKILVNSQQFQKYFKNVF